VMVQLRTPEFFRVFILEHNLGRFGSDLFRHKQPFWYYIPVMLVATAPWTFFVATAFVTDVREWWRSRKDAVERQDGFVLFLLLWIIIPVAFFSLSKSKLPGYILPAIAPGILLLANYLRERLASRIHPLVIALHCALVAALLFSALMLPTILAQHKLVWSPAVTVPLVVSLIAGALVAVALLKVGWTGLHLSGSAPAIVALALALRFGAPVMNSTLSARPVSEALSISSNEPLPVAVALVSRELEFGLQFYRNEAIPRYEWGQAPASEHLLVAKEGSEKLLARSLQGRRITPLRTFPAQKLMLFYVGR
jgi:4-amino-4-deoxy-L-arabinose transferase-like glycosyltransferase